ncbi:hypothetical protein, partial [Enterobacter hormaechei]|uniref:hypothetical protein n=1 Tax=Enterobacter hormaechei TaxID=158836 RepID=UPI001BAEAF40
AMENTMGGIIVNPAVNMHADKMSDEHINMFDTVFKDMVISHYCMSEASLWLASSIPLLRFAVLSMRKARKNHWLR